MLMELLSPVPDVPQEVTFSERVVTSVFVTWRPPPPPGQVEKYKVRHVDLISKFVHFQVKITEKGQLIRFECDSDFHTDMRNDANDDTITHIT